MLCQYSNGSSFSVSASGLKNAIFGYFFLISFTVPLTERLTADFSLDNFPAVKRYENGFPVALK